MTQHISSDLFCPIDNKGKYKDCAPSFRCGVRISATTSGSVARLQIHMKTSLSYIISIIVLYSIVLSKFTNLGQTLLLYSYGAKMASILIDHIIHNLCNFCSAGHVDGTTSPCEWRTCMGPWFLSSWSLGGNRERGWIQKGSMAHHRLTELVLDARWLKSINIYTLGMSGM